MDLIPVTLLTGFLGSGKTTLLNKLVASPAGADCAVLINEFGDIALDHLLVDCIADDIVLLESGCVCCSVRDDFSSALLNLYEKRQHGKIPAFTRVILETTGIADPAAIHEFLMSGEEIIQRYRYNNTVTVIDGIFGQNTLSHHIEAVKQVAISDQIVISKTDLASAYSIEKLLQRLAGLNPAVRLQNSDVIDTEPDLLFEATRYEPQQPVSPTAVRRQNAFQFDHRFSTYTVSWPEAVDWHDFTDWLDALLAARGDSIHRLKGLARITGRQGPVVIQGVQYSFYPPSELDSWPANWSDNGPHTRLVFITTDFPKQAAINSTREVFEVTVT